MRVLTQNTICNVRRNLETIKLCIIAEHAIKTKPTFMQKNFYATLVW